jgi:nitrogen fixation NifU-like protein
MSEKLDEMYRDIIMDHYRYPRGKKRLDHADLENMGKNPACGDEIELSLKMDGDKVADIAIGCQGCAISIASGSMLSEIVKGRSVEEVKKIAAVVKALIKGEPLPKDHGLDLGDIEALQGVKNFPVRIKCALLAWTTLTDSLETYENKLPSHVTSTE